MENQYLQSILKKGLSTCYGVVEELEPNEIQTKSIGFYCRKEGKYVSLLVHKKKESERESTEF